MYNKTIIEFGFRMISCSTSSNNNYCLIGAVLQFNLHNKLNYVCMQDKEIMLHKKIVKNFFTGAID